MSNMTVSQFLPQGAPPAAAPMTVNGTVVRTAMLLVVSGVAAVAGWLFLPPGLTLLAFLAAIGGSVAFSVMASRRPMRAKLPAFGYALVQGVVVGAAARSFEASYDGIVVTALLATAVTVAVTLVLFATRVVRVSAKARSYIAMAALSAFVFYAGSFVLSLFGVQVPGLSGGGLLGIGLSLVMLGIATATLFSEYSVVDEAIAAGAGEEFEWFAAFGICSSVLWVFVEMLRLLSRFR